MNIQLHGVYFFNKFSKCARKLVTRYTWNFQFAKFFPLRGDEQIPRNPKQQKDENETAVPSLLLSAQYPLALIKVEY